MRRQKPHEALTRYRLCKEFGWTLRELDEQPAKEVEEFIIIQNELDEQTRREMERAERGAKPRLRT